MKNYFFSILFALFSGFLHALLGNTYVYIAPIVEETLKYASSRPSKTKLEVIATYTVFAFIEFLWYYLLSPTPAMAYARIKPFLFHVLTGVIMSYGRDKHASIALLTNIALHYCYLFI